MDRNGLVILHEDFLDNPPVDLNGRLIPQHIVNKVSSSCTVNNFL